MRILSLPGAGLHFTLKLLRYLGERHCHAGHLDALPIPDGPCIIPLRDPLMVEITRLNRGMDGHISDWVQIAALAERPQTHYLRVDTDDPASEIARLARFLGRPVPTTPFVWSAAWETTDRLALKPSYHEGRTPPALAPAASWYGSAAAQGVRTFMAAHGYR